MSGNDPLAPMARLARRIPGYPVARRVLVPRVRGNAVFRAIAHKLWVTEVAADGRGADLTAGKLLAGVDTHTLPVVIFVIAAVPADRQQAVVDEIAEIQLLTGGFRPVLVFAEPDFAPARRHGYPAELLPSQATDAADQVRYWQRLRQTYGSVLVSEVPADGLTPVQRAHLLAMAGQG